MDSTWLKVALADVRLVFKTIPERSKTGNTLLVAADYLFG